MLMVSSALMQGNYPSWSNKLLCRRNTDVITMREALLLIKKKLVNAMHLCEIADEYKEMPCLGFTHFQPAQPTTVGKRATLWLMDLVMDYEEVNHVLDTLMLLGSKGTTGTQASFLELFMVIIISVKSLIRKLQKKWALRHASLSADRLMQESLIQLFATVLLLLLSPAASFPMI